MRCMVSEDQTEEWKKRGCLNLSAVRFTATFRRGTSRSRLHPPPPHDFDLGHGFLYGRRANSGLDSSTIPTTRRGRRSDGGDDSIHLRLGQEEEKEEV